MPGYDPESGKRASKRTRKVAKRQQKARHRPSVVRPDAAGGYTKPKPTVRYEDRPVRERQAQLRSKGVLAPKYEKKIRKTHRERKQAEIAASEARVYLTQLAQGRTTAARPAGIPIIRSQKQAERLERGVRELQRQEAKKAVQESVRTLVSAVQGQKRVKPVQSQDIVSRTLRAVYGKPSAGEREAARSAGTSRAASIAAFGPNSRWTQIPMDVGAVAYKKPSHLADVPGDIISALPAIPAGVLRAVTDPAGEAQETVADYERRYGGTSKERRQRMLKEGITPEILDLAAFGTGAGAVAGRIIQRAKPITRKDVRVGAGEGNIRVQTSEDWFRNLIGSKLIDPTRQAQQKRRAERGDQLALAAEESGQVTYVGRPKRDRAVRREISKENARSRVGMKIEQREVEAEVLATHHSLSPDERRGFKYAVQYGIPDAETARDLLSKHRDRIIAQRTADLAEGKDYIVRGIPKKQDELPDIDWLIENAEKAFTDNTRQAALKSGSLARKTADIDPSLRDLTPLARSVTPLAELLGIERRGGESERGFRRRVQRERKAAERRLVSADKALLRAERREAYVRGGVQATAPTLDAKILRQVPEYVQVAKDRNKATRALSDARKNYGNQARYKGQKYSDENRYRHMEEIEQRVLRAMENDDEITADVLQAEWEMLDAGRGPAAAAAARVRAAEQYVKNASAKQATIKEDIARRADEAVSKKARGETNLSREEQLLIPYGRGPTKRLEQLEKARANVVLAEQRKAERYRDLQELKPREGESSEQFASRLRQRAESDEDFVARVINTIRKDEDIDAVDADFIAFANRRAQTMEHSVTGMHGDWWNKNPDSITGFSDRLLEDPSKGHAIRNIVAAFRQADVNLKNGAPGTVQALNAELRNWVNPAHQGRLIEEWAAHHDHPPEGFLAGARNAERIEEWRKRSQGNPDPRSPVLDIPGYYPSKKRSAGFFEAFARGGPGARAADRTYEGHLTRTGREVSDPRILTAQLALNVKRKYSWKYASDMIEDNTFEWGKNMSLNQLLDEIERRGAEDYVVPVNLKKMYAVRETLMNDGDAVPSGDPPDRIANAELHAALTSNHVSLTGATIREMIAERAEAKRLGEDWKPPPEYADSKYHAMDKTAYTELEADSKPTRALGRIYDVIKGKVSRILLGNPAWLQFQIAANGFLAGMAGVGPVNAVKSAVWFSRLTPEQRLAIEPYIGVHPWYDEQIRLGETVSSNSIVNAYRAFKQGSFYRQAHKGNPLNVIFRGDQMQNNFFRRAVFYTKAKRAMYTKMGQDAGKIINLQGRLEGFMDVDGGGKLESYLDNLDNIERHADETLSFMGDYMSYTNFERRMLGRSVQFIGFLRFAVKFTFWTMPVNHPTLSALMTQMGRMEEEEIKRIFGVDVPFWEKGKFYFNDGKNRINLMRMNPFFNALGLEQAGFGPLLQTISPVIQIPLNQVFSMNLGLARQWQLYGETERLKPIISGIPPWDPVRFKVLVADVAKLSPYYRIAEKTGIPGVTDPLIGTQGAESSLLFPEPIKYSPKRIDTYRREQERRARMEERSAGALIGETLFPIARPRFPEVLPLSLGEEGMETIRKTREHHRLYGKGRKKKPRGNPSKSSLSKGPSSLGSSLGSLGSSLK